MSADYRRAEAEQIEARAALKRSQREQERADAEADYRERRAAPARLAFRIETAETVDGKLEALQKAVLWLLAEASK